MTEIGGKRLKLLLPVLVILISACSDPPNRIALHVSGVVLPDVEDSMTAQQALQKAAENNLPKASKVMTPVNWIVADIRNPTDETEWVINLSSELIEYVDFYIFEDNQLLEHRRTGRLTKTKQQMFSTYYGYYFSISIPKGAYRSIVIRTQTPYYYSIGAWAQPAPIFWGHSNRDTIITVLATGMIAGLMLYNLFLALRIRDLNYLLYSLHAMGFLGFYLNTHSYYQGVVPFLASALGWPDLFTTSTVPIYRLDSLFILLIQFCGALFCYRFLEIHKISTLMKRLFQFYLAVVILEALLFPVANLKNYALFNGIWFLVLGPLVISGSLLAVIKKVPQSFYLLIGWSILLSNNSISLLEIMGVIDYSVYTAVRAPVATALEMLIFSMALADRVRTLMKDKAVAEQASQAKSAFLATMSHEIRTPLYGVLGTAQLLGRTELTGKQRDYLQSIDYSGQALLSVINEILDYSKLEAGAIKLENSNFDLRRLIYSMVALMKDRADEKALELSCAIDENIPRLLYGDANRLRQILLNLLGNAVKFTEQGSVSVEVILLERIDDHYALKFSVQDTGIGIEHSAKAHIFSRFEQADSTISRRFGGTGLGLAIAKKTVAAMNGSIDFVSEPEKGSCFFFTITLPDGQSETPDDFSQVLPGTRLQLNILVVDDIEINRDVTADLMHYEGHNVTVADSGKQALALMKDQTFDVVLMDVHMPTLDGTEVTRQLRERDDLTPIIGFTASVMPDERAHCLASGMNAVVAKPLELDDLNQVLSGLFPEEKGSNEFIDGNRMLQQHRDKIGKQKLLSLLNKYCELSGRHLEDIDRAFQEHDLESMADHAHQLAGMAGLMGFLEFSEQAGILEKYSIDGDTNELENCIRTLRERFMLTLKMVEAEKLRE